MNPTTVAAFFMPPEFLVLAVAAAGIAVILGAKKLAASIFMFIVACIALPPIVTVLVQLAPIWVLWAGLLYLVFLIPYALVALFGALLIPVLGERAVSHVTGDLAAGLSRTLLVAPFRALAWIARRLAGAIR